MLVETFVNYMHLFMSEKVLFKDS